MVPWKFTNRTLLFGAALGFGLFLIALVEVIPLRDLKFDVASWPAIDEQLDHFIAGQKAEGFISLSENWSRRSSPELAQPETLFYSSPVSKEFAHLFNGEKDTCQNVPKTTGTNPQVVKGLEVNKYLCANEIPPVSVVSQPPLFHPFGGTWMAWIYNHSKKDEASKTWLQENQKNLHLLELSQYPFLKLSASEKILAALTPGQLSDFISGHVLIVTQQFVILLYQAKLGARDYQLYSKKTWDDFIAHQSITVVSVESSACQIREGIICWGTNETLKDKRNFWFLICIISAFISLALVSIHLYLQRSFLLRQTELDREIIMQTLAHELRHPVTSFMLSLEVFRDYFDEFPDSVKTEFLRMSDQTVRLKRLIHSSRQYLQTQSQTGKPFRFHFVEIPSLKEYLQTALESYLEKIDLDLNFTDLKFYLDPYWIQVCLQNLVKNALVHGQKPIRLKVQFYKTDQITISVEDSGPAPTLTFKEMIIPFKKSKTSSGLGLGLNLVYRLSHLMGGELTFLQKPNRFMMRIKNQNG